MTDKIEAKSVRTRIAPSPTGYPHIGTVYQALFDFAYAKRYSGKFIVRIEDTDRDRFVVDAEEKLFQAFDWFGLTENESPRKGGDYGPYRQSERLPLYQQYTLELIEKGHAYYCFCSKVRLEEVRQKQQAEHKPPMYDKHCRNLAKGEIGRKLEESASYVVRMKIPENEHILVHDEIRGNITFDSNTIDDQVILKSDGYPTYHLAVVVDDHLMEITHIVRGEEWLPSSSKHALLYRFLGWEMPLLYHTSVLRNPDRSKLSKRQGHTIVSWYQEEGYLPEAILNYLALLGWSHPEEKEIFSLDEFIEKFDLKDISPVGPIFDLIKLNWMNQHYIQSLPLEELRERLVSYDQTLKEVDPALFFSILPLVQTRINTLKDFRHAIQYFLRSDPVVLSTDQEKEITRKLLSDFTAITDWQEDTIFAVCKDIMQQFSVRMPVLYTVITGEPRGLPLPQSLAILGKEKVLEKLTASLNA